jgi:aminoglycoside N3'-acetyltransferase
MAITRSIIVKKLKELGLLKRDIIEVHSSLNSFGEVKGGPETVIAALIDIVGDSGAIIMSAYPLSPPVSLSEEDMKHGIYWKVKRLHSLDNTRTSMGIISDTFAKRNDVILGEGVHRVCAWGKDKEIYAEKGYAAFIQAQGKVVLLGVDIHRCSSMHQAEDQPLPEEIEKYYALDPQIYDLYPPGEWGVGGGEPPGDAWSKIFDWAKTTGHVKSITIGKALCCSFPVKELTDEYRRLRKEDPYTLFDVKKRST